MFIPKDAGRSWEPLLLGLGLLVVAPSREPVPSLAWLRIPLDWTLGRFLNSPGVHRIVPYTGGLFDPYFPISVGPPAALSDHPRRVPHPV